MSEIPITEEEYKKISIRLHKLLGLYKREEIDNEQIMEKIFDCFFTSK